MTEPFAWWSADAIAAASRCPLENVEDHWPRIVMQLDLCGITTPNVALGVIGTTAIEGASTFEPVREGCYLGEPEPAESHRRGLAYYPYFGRGHIQLTHAGNYRKYGPLVADLWGTSSQDPAFDFITNPDRALDPCVAAAVIALYFRDTRALPSASWPQGYSLLDACAAQDWEWVRLLVYGGVDVVGATRIAQIAQELGPPAGGSLPVTLPLPGTQPLPVYDSSYPAISQNDNWSCSCTSMRWALFAYGRTPTEAWLENSMLSEGVVSRNDGLLNSTGQQLAEWAIRHYGEFGYSAQHDPNVSFDDVAQEAQTRGHPLLIGGRGWYHWSGCRGYADGKLLLANPASGWKGITQTMSREQFEYLGAFSMVRLTHPAAESGLTPPITVPPTGPPPDPNDPYGPWRNTVGSGLLDMMAQDQTLPAQRASTWLPLGTAPPSDIEQCAGQNGQNYTWHLTTNKGYRYAPS